MIRDNKYYLLLENGVILDKVANNKISKSVPVIKQFTQNDRKQLGKLIFELDKLPRAIQNIISEIIFFQPMITNSIYIYIRNICL